MPSHPHTVINEELPRDRDFELRLIGADAGFVPAQAATFHRKVF